MVDEYTDADLVLQFEEMRALIEAQAERIAELESVIKEIISQIDQGGSGGKVFARDYCIQRARKVVEEQ